MSFNQSTWKFGGPAFLPPLPRKPLSLLHPNKLFGMKNQGSDENHLDESLPAILYEFMQSPLSGKDKKSSASLFGACAKVTDADSGSSSIFSTSDASGESFSTLVPTPPFMELTKAKDSDQNSKSPIHKNSKSPTAARPLKHQRRKPLLPIPEGFTGRVAGDWVQIRSKSVSSFLYWYHRVTGESCARLPTSSDDDESTEEDEDYGKKKSAKSRRLRKNGKKKGDSVRRLPRATNGKQISADEDEEIADALQHFFGVPMLRCEIELEKNVNFPALIAKEEERLARISLQSHDKPNLKRRKRGGGGSGTRRRKRARFST